MLIRCFARRCALSAIALVGVSIPLSSQNATRRAVSLATEPRTPAPDANALTRAVRTVVPVVIDGKDDDPVWSRARVTTDFRQYSLREDGAPTFQTEFKVAYDDHSLYVFVRALDAHPDSIRHAVARRDGSYNSDIIGITIDGFHDRRTGFEFAVNPDGAKKDCAVYADTLFDWSWDGVWDAATRVDSAGWTAEFRIPFSQIRYANLPAHTFGLAVWRNIGRYNESSSWPLWRFSRGGLMGQLANLSGVDSISAPRNIAVTPYTVASNSSRRTGNAYDRAQRSALGADARIVVRPSLAIDATVNPDFGQVEADPSVLNLTAAETFYPEKRPFFLQGSRLYQFDIGCTIASCANEGLFYSRRIGRAPQLLNAYGTPDSPVATPIATAAKLTGRTDGGFSLVALDAATERVSGIDNRTIEPRTNYALVRGQRELRGGRSAIGFMMTAVNRALDSSSVSSLRRAAYVGALDFRHRVGTSPYVLSGSLVGSDVAGSRAAIVATQTAPSHLYQRPDAGIELDSTRTSLVGHSEELSLGKYSGTLQFVSAWQRHSAGFEINDIGYLQRANTQSASFGAQAQTREPYGVFQRVTGNIAWDRFWTTNWLPIDHAVSGHTNVRFTDNWIADATLLASQLPGTLCSDCARGGPALRQDVNYTSSLSIKGDNRHWAVPALAFTHASIPATESHVSTIVPSLAVQPWSRLQATLGATVQRTHDKTQWYGNFADTAGKTHYSFATLDQQTVSVTMRGSFAATPNFTVELYTAPFLSSGAYSEIRELSATPRAAAYDARFISYAQPRGQPLGFHVRQMRSNLVTRWEFRPGSTLFVVWADGRDSTDALGGLDVSRQDYRRLLAAHPDNTFLVKLSYWLDK